MVIGQYRIRSGSSITLHKFTDETHTLMRMLVSISSGVVHICWPDVWICTLMQTASSGIFNNFFTKHSDEYTWHFTLIILGFGISFSRYYNRRS